jgi:sensor histidine kinase regulating citrate/malate metabolism
MTYKPGGGGESSRIKKEKYKLNIKVNDDGIGIDYIARNGEVYSQGYRLWGDDCEIIGKFLYEHLVKKTDMFRSVTIDVDGVEN